MILSDERINHLSHLILTVLKKEALAKIADEIKVLNGVKKAIREFGDILEAIETQVRKKITSLKRQIPEGSREWDLLYKQYFDEELYKKGL